MAKSAELEKTAPLFCVLSDLLMIRQFIFQFDDYLIVSINGDGTESEEFLTRKTLVFIRLMGFVNGPVIDE